MAGHDANFEKLESLPTWGGKVSPFKTSYGKMMMWFFLVSDALTFGGFLVGYGFSRYAYQGSWPIGEETFHSMPFLEGNYPLMYVALMTFLLIVSSVTMVLAVEAGHRMDKKGVVKWMIATVIGGFFFLGSQAWEWSHFIHGSKFGKVELSDGSMAIVHAEEFGALKNFQVVQAGSVYKMGQTLTDKDMDLMHEFQHAAEAGHIHDNKITLNDGSVATIAQEPYKGMTLVIKQAGAKYKLDQKISGEEAVSLYTGVINSGEPLRVIYGANLVRNEYGPKQYAQFFFFITGFHGFHVATGVLINIIILIGAARGVYQARGHYEMVEKAGLYWHFVDLVWVFVFTFFYLV